MLDPWIIEEIRRREEEERRQREERERPLLEIPRDPPREREREVEPQEEWPSRGVTVVDYGFSP